MMHKNIHQYNRYGYYADSTGTPSFRQGARTSTPIVLKPYKDAQSYCAKRMQAAHDRCKPRALRRPI